jgi:hypothetical protein
MSGGFMQANLILRSVKFCAALMVVAVAIIPAGISSAQTKGKAAAELHMCGLLSPEDVAPIVGARPMSQETTGGTTCLWGDPSRDPNKPRLLIQAPMFAQYAGDPLGGVNVPSRDRMETNFKANRKQVFEDKSAQAKDEPGLGKFAFSALTEDGVEIIILKKNGLLNIQFLTGKRGTPENVETIRKVAAKVAASF